ncbi:MAG TPA: hypothetical protein VKU02_20625, partial [Gemmataceae bacterium]|nr:hypothetical protein [Gemmataceae bacterium]
QSIKPETLSPVQLLSLRSLVQALQTRGQLLPYPEDDLGDVKNLVGAPGGNDSIWIDLGYPVLTAPNGQKYKPLFAPLILDLDNRINLNVHGNIRGGTKGNRFFVANQGWGPWTVDVSQILNYQATQTTPPEEWKQLFYGLTIDPSENRVVGAPIQPGRYGLNTIVANDNTTVFPPPHAYAPVDYDECDPTGQRTVAISLQNGTNCFPLYPPTGFDNLSAAERTNHPSRYNVIQPVPGQQRRFPVSDMEALLRFGDTGSPFLTSELLRLCPHNFSGDFYGDPLAAQRRRLVTVRSFDVERPGVTPWLTQYHGQIQTQGNYSLPYGLAPAFSFLPPGPPQSPQQLLQDPNDFRLAATGTNQIGTDWRAATAALGRLDLNRPLPPYPTPGGNGVINDGDPTTLRRFQAAELARQQLAEDIYIRLINVTGVFNPFLDPKLPTHQLNPADISALRALAQLAVNIVDLIDSDDFSTPFHWGAIGHPNFQQFVENLGQTPQWVFGVEMPHVLINEAYAQYTIQNENVTKAGTKHPITVETWVELYNPLSPDPSLPFSGNAYLNSGVGQNRGYRLILAKPNATAVLPGTSTDDYLRLPANSRGNPYNPQKPQDFGIFQTAPNQPAIVDFVDKPRPIPHFVNTSSGGPGPQGYFVIGPTGAKGPAMPAGSQVYTRPEMSYTLPDGDPYILRTNSGLRPAAPTVVLQRLACPYLPHNPLPNDPEFAGQNNPNRPINPYITIDYFSDVNKEANQIQQNQVYIRNDNKMPLDPKAASEGRREPFAGNSTQKVLQTSGASPKHSFFQKNDNIQSNFDWLVHLDRELISPMELMHVAAVKPALLTQEFINPPGGTTGGHMVPFNHRVPWYDEDRPSTGSVDSHRLHRFFEFVATRSRAAGLEAPVIQGRLVQGANDQIRVNRLSWLTASGSLAAIKVGDVLVLDKGLDPHENVRVKAIVPVTPTDIRVQLFNPLIKSHGNAITVELTTMGERVPGKININTIWDPPTFQALANPTTSNFPPPSSANSDSWGIQAMFANLILQRSPGLNQGTGSLTAADRPFLGMAAGHYSSEMTVPFYPAADKYGVSGVNHTLLGAAQLGGTNTSKRLLQVPFQAPSNSPQHPFIANQLLTKLFNNVTTRSNVFAVWMTVGFFEVIDDTARPAKLGAEIGKSENRQIRHRMFSIVDRTALTVPSPIGSLVGTVPSSGLHSVKMDQVTNSIAVGPLPPVGPIDPTLGRAAPQQIVWTLQPNDIIVVGEGTANQEMVAVTAVDVQNRVLTANFARPHAATETVTLHVVPGNPGPTTRFDPRDPIYDEVVPYLSIIE